MEPAVVAQAARAQVCFARGPEALLNNFRQLKIRAGFAWQSAYIYIEQHLCGVGMAEGAKAIREQHGGDALAESLRLQWPSCSATRLLPHGGKLSTNVSGFEGKHATMPDAAQPDLNDVFDTVRPPLALDQSSVENAHRR